MLSGRRALLPRSLVAAIVGITVVPLATLLWLGWRLISQDRALEGQQAQERLERAADLASAALQRALSSSEQRMLAGAFEWPDGAVVVTFHEARVDVHPKSRVAYLPAVPVLPEAGPAPFAVGEELEFVRRDPAAAVRAYGELAESPDRAIRAGALLRLARNLQKEGRIDEALAAYDELSALDGVLAGSVPAGLVARYARCKLFEDHGRGPELRSEAARLGAELAAARWPLTAPVYWLYAGDAARWSGRDPGQLLPAELFAEAAAVLAARSSHLQGAGRESLRIGDRTLTALWSKADDSLTALIVAPAFVESEWLPAAAPVSTGQQFRLALANREGAALFGEIDPSGRRAVRSAADTALPWNMVVMPANPQAADREFAMRRRLLISGLALLLSMALAAAWLISRAVSRELAVARLQSDFVAAVSHEFRTPLTSLRQFTDMLRDHDHLDEDRRRLCYEAQSRATDRLTRLVESLLDFGCMEAGSRPYRFESRDCAELVRRAVDEFRDTPQAAGYAIEFHPGASGQVDADGEALSRAVWNLLENAVKYSPDRGPIEVGVDRANGGIRIAVRDHGIGVPRHEQAAIFARFRRGEQARSLGIRGTGIGLAMVDQIVKAHRGRVELESEPRQGSSFIIVLPLKEDPCRAS